MNFFSSATLYECLPLFWSSGESSLNIHGSENGPVVGVWSGIDKAVVNLDDGLSVSLTSRLIWPSQSVHTITDMVSVWLRVAFCCSVGSFGLGSALASLSALSCVSCSTIVSGKQSEV